MQTENGLLLGHQQKSRLMVSLHIHATKACSAKTCNWYLSQFNCRLWNMNDDKNIVGLLQLSKNLDLKKLNKKLFQF